MSIDSIIQNTTVFVLGSPGSGFSSYPKKYLRLVEKFDDSTLPKGSLRSEYKIRNNSAALVYIKYGLIGASKHVQVRGGRNFGLVIQTEGFRVNEAHVKMLYPYLDKVFTQSIIDGLKILKTVDDNYQITLHDFLSIEERLLKVLAVIKDHFIKEFKDSFVGISQDKFYELDPIKIKLRIDEEKRKKKELQLKRQTRPNENENLSSKESEINIEEEIPEDVRQWDFKFIFTAILSLIVLALLISHIVHVYKARKFRSQIENEFIRLQSTMSGAENDSESSNIQIIGSNTKESTNDEEEETDARELVYIVKSGETLQAIVIKYNETYNTNFKTKDIAKLNDVDPAKIRAGQEIKFPE